MNHDAVSVQLCRNAGLSDVDTDALLVRLKDGTRALDKQEGGGPYKSMTIQPIEFIFKNGIGYAEGNVIKYVTRWRSTQTRSSFGQTKPEKRNRSRKF